MNERELRTALTEKQEAYELAKKEGKSTEELRSIVGEIRELRAQLDLELEVRANSVPELNEVVKTEERKTEESIDEAYNKLYSKIIRNRLTNADKEELRALEERAKLEPGASATPFLKSKVDENGGYIVPKDVQTKINEYKRANLYDLSKLITVEQTNFASGTRVFEKLATQTGFVNIEEWDKIEEIAAPQFEQKAYAMKAYAGILPVPRQLLQDTDAALRQYLDTFIARKSVFTRNTQILAVLKALPKRTTAVSLTDDVKNIVNVELDGAFAKNAKIVTNQDGFNWLDKCKDEKGNYLMQRDITSSTGFSLLGREVEVVPNSVLASTANKAPLFIGDLKEAARLFDRDAYEVLATEVGGNAFFRNSFDIRVIDRFDVVKWDDGAVISTEIDVSKEPAFPSTGKKSA